MTKPKPIHAKPSLYAYYFLQLKEIALTYGYNLVLHGSLNRDLDLIAIPWKEEIGNKEEMIKEFCEYIGGYLLMPDATNDFKVTHHGRMQYVININRGGYKGDEYIEDPYYYIDISVMPALPKPAS